MDFLIITGLSGAGKSRVAAVLEDMNYYCVDNMPVALMPKFTELCLATHGKYERVALVTDVRAWGSYSELFIALEEMQKMGCDHKILFIEAEIATIVKRYKETRRRHPIAQDGESIEHAVRREIELLRSVKEKADYVIDSSDLTLGQLQRKLYGMFGGTQDEKGITITVSSFGFKHGIPLDADMVFDVRFLPNPYYSQDLKELNGLDERVKEFIFKYDMTTEFLHHLTGFVSFLLPHFIEEGKSYLSICIGCTGGHHRSVAIAQYLAEDLSSKGYRVECIHRDIEK